MKNDCSAPIAGLNSVYAQTEYARESFVKMQRAEAQAKKILQACERVKTAYNFDENDLIDDISLFESTLMSTCTAIYKTISRRIIIPGERPASIAETNDYERLGKSVLGIKAAYINGQILLGMPMLSRRTSYFVHTASGSIPTHYSTIFDADVRAAMASIYADFTEDLNNFVEKTLTFFFNYNDVDATENDIIDSDSHDTKSTIDAITSFFLGGDTGKTTSISYTTTTQKSLPTGTYICTKPGRENYATESVLTLFEAFNTETTFKKTPENCCKSFNNNFPGD